MATTAFVREIHSFTSIKCKEQSPSPPDTHPQSSESPKMAPTELHHPNAQHVSSTIFEMTNQDSDKSSPEFNSSDSNDMAPVYPYSALQQMQAVYGGGSILQPPTSTPNAVFPKCMLCDYVPVSDSDSKAHESMHFPFKCSTCAYVAKTEGRLKSHESKYHSLVPPSTWVGSQDGGASGKRPIVATSLKVKKRPVKCKLCNIVSSDKCGYYNHLREAHDDPKLLKCDRCPFATHYKHHLEYHLRNHYGSKPFQCDLCNYSCVNKSMLNSHKKSHSNVYQFRCAECSYATKYCHSLKMHLVKYEHRPGETLNPDGTPNTTAVIDVHGRRRGPKTKRKTDKRSNNKHLTSESMDKALYPKYPSIPLQPPAVYLNPKVYNNFSGTVFYRPSLVDNSNCSLLPRQQPPHIPGRDISRCPYCNFYSDSGPVFTAHIMNHVGMDPKQFFPFNYMEGEMMRMNSFKTDFGAGNYFAPKEGETSPSETPAKASDGGASSPPTNGDSSDAYSSPRSNSDAYSGWMQAQPQSHYPELSALNLARPKTSTPAAKTTAVRESYEPQTDTPSVLDLSVKSSSERQRTDSSSPNTSQSSSTSYGANDQPVPPTRNRRKGKAFKLDCYLREEEGATDFMPSRNETERVLEHPVRGFEVPKTSQNSAVRSEISTNMKQKRKLDTSEDFVYKKFALSPPNEERSFHQPFLNTPSPPFTPSISQNTANNAHALPSPTQSLTSHSPNSTTPSPDRGLGQDARSPRLATEPAPGEDRPVPKVVIKVEPMDFDSKPNSNVKRCYYCDLIFGDQEMFAMHNRYHSEGDPFTCGICGVKCYDRVTLYNHLLNTPHPNIDTEITVLGVVKH